MNAPRLLRDPHGRWALAAAPVVWVLGYLWFAPATDWAWPLHHPRELLILGLLYPLVEELLFRGVLQGWLRERAALCHTFAGLSWANLLTSTLFTALHFIAHPPLAALAVFVPSLIFGHFRDRYGGLRAPIALHMYYNTGYFWIFSGGA
ncbi:MAG: JDVT-CTERM system glutamic-type intramembrane protease [Gammaproteobacteria bacterium]